MNKMLIAAMLTTIVGLTGCATTEQSADSAETTAEAGQSKIKDTSLVTGSRIPTSRSAMVSATDASDAQKQLRDNPKPFTFKQ